MGQDKRMAIRDADGVRTNEATEIAEKVSNAIRPIFENAMNRGFTPEDFCYLVYAEADLMGLTYLREKKWTTENEKAISILQEAN